MRVRHVFKIAKPCLFLMEMSNSYNKGKYLFGLTLIWIKNVLISTSMEAFEPVFPKELTPSSLGWCVLYTAL